MSESFVGIFDLFYRRLWIAKDAYGNMEIKEVFVLMAREDIS